MNTGLIVLLTIIGGPSIMTTIVIIIALFIEAMKRKHLSESIISCRLYDDIYYDTEKIRYMWILRDIGSNMTGESNYE